LEIEIHYRASQESFAYFDHPQSLAQIEHTGKITYILRRKLETTCVPVSFNNEEQSCPIKLGSWTADGGQVRY
jgi:hypothetical protein